MKKRLLLGLTLVLFSIAGIITPAKSAIFKITATQVNPTCVGSCDGSINVNATGGYPPYTYQWSNGANTSMITGLCADTFTVTVTDDKGSSLSLVKIIRNPYAVGLSSSTVKQVSCYGSCDGSITVVAKGGTAPYTYLWSNGETTASIENLCAGPYTLTVTDSKGCTFSCVKTILQPKQLAASVVKKVNASCPGSCDGSAEAKATGGKSPYTYLWSTGDTTKNVSGLCKGQYSLTVTDANGCTAVSSFNISQPAVIKALVSSTDVTCNGECNGTAQISVSGGSGSYSYLWSDGSTGTAVQNLCEGNYSVTITDSKSCSIQKTVLINEPDEMKADCEVVSQEDGILLASAQGGKLPYTYLWSTGAVTAQVSGLAAGVYTVTVTDNNGCSAESFCEIIYVPCNGQFRTQTMGGWGQCHQTGNNPGTYLAQNFALAFPNGLTVGCGTYSIHFSNSTAICEFLPSGSNPRALNANYTDPAGSYKNVFAGQVTALAVSLGFDAYDAGFGSSSSLLSNQIITSGPFAGFTVGYVFAEANKKLGGCASIHSLSDLHNTIGAINENYVDGNQNKGYLACPGTYRTSLNSDSPVISAWPNPFSGVINISLDTENTSRVIITDISGKILEVFENVSGIINSGEKFEAGIYFIRSESAGKTQVLKIIKQ